MCILTQCFPPFCTLLPWPIPLAQAVEAMLNPFLLPLSNRILPDPSRISAAWDTVDHSCFSVLASGYTSWRFPYTWLLPLPIVPLSTLHLSPFRALPVPADNILGNILLSAYPGDHGFIYLSTHHLPFTISTSGAINLV